MTWVQKPVFVALLQQTARLEKNKDDPMSLYTYPTKEKPDVSIFICTVSGDPAYRDLFSDTGRAGDWSGVDHLPGGGDSGDWCLSAQAPGLSDLATGTRRYGKGADSGDGNDGGAVSSGQWRPAFDPRLFYRHAGLLIIVAATAPKCDHSSIKKQHMAFPSKGECFFLPATAPFRRHH